MADSLLDAASELSGEVDSLNFAEPVSHVYNPLAYAWETHQSYLRKASTAGARVVFLGMNPGPWGMAQTGVPFGEVAAVSGWLQIRGEVSRPDREHPKRPVEGFNCRRSEVSGRRLWGLFRERFGQADRFFDEHFVANYCPLVFMESSGKNRTPDKLGARERDRLTRACDKHLAELLKILKPEWAIGVGVYAEKCLSRVVASAGVKPNVSRILHPSPASPAANRDWSGTVTRRLQELGIWT